MSRRMVIAIGVLVLVLSRFSYPSKVADRKTSPPRIASHTELIRSYGELPLTFERNEGQTDPRVKFVSRGNGYTLFLTPTEAVLALRKPENTDNKKPTKFKPQKTETDVLRVKLQGAQPSPQIEGVDQQAGRANYFIGNDSKKWRTKVPLYSRVRCRGVYPGIDLVYRGSNQHQLEYDFEIAPGADPASIGLAFDGAKQLKIDDRGNLIVSTSGGDLIEYAPVIYQQAAGRRERVSGRYSVRRKHIVGFEVGAYDKHQRLIIDPVLVYSTFLGGGAEGGYSIAIDSSGDAYVTGSAESTDFPTTAGAYQTTLGSASGNAFITKLNANGTALVYSTYLGGSTTDDGNGIAVDSSGNAYVTGVTASTNFPTTAGAFQTTLGSALGNAFITKLNANGTALVYSTYLGGSGQDQGSGIALNSSGDAYVTGYTYGTNFPTTAGAFQTTYPGRLGNHTAFVTELNGNGSALVYSTYLGGSIEDEGSGIAVNSSGDAYVTGSTQSFPTTVGAFQTTYPGSGNDTAFVTELNGNGSAQVYSTYLGGSGGEDNGLGIALNSSGDAYVTGFTSSTNFPTTAGAFQTTHVEGGGAFVTELNGNGSALVYSTYLGSSGGSGIALDSSGDAYVTGQTNSTNFPTTVGAFQTTYPGSGNQTAFVTELNGNGSALVYSTYLGGSGQDVGRGIAVDSIGDAYVTGVTISTNFPTTAGAFQTTYPGPGPTSSNAFVAKFAPCSRILRSFNGNLTISSGFICIMDGTVTGNLTVNGGGVLTNNATIGGNVHITGGSIFSIESTAIIGDMQVQNISTRSAQNQICGANVKGDLQVSNNAVGVEIGGNFCAANTIRGNLQVSNNSSSVPILGDSIGGDVQVTNNTAPEEVSNDTVNGNLQITNNSSVQVSGDTVRGSVQCGNNSSITGGGDTASSLQGQCAGFSTTVMPTPTATPTVIIF